MLLTKPKLAEAKPPAERLKLRWDVVFKDLRLLASMTLAHFIVWRTLRRRHSEKAARRREFNWLPGGGSMAQAQSQVVHGFDWRADAVPVLGERGKEGG